MLALQRLLKFTPDEAIMMVANYGLGTYLRPEICEVGVPVRLSGDLSRVTITSKVTNFEMIQNPYSGQVALTYNRYDLGRLFEKIILNITLPTTVSNIAERIAQNTGIVLTEEDFVPGVIRTKQYVLRASTTSKRWVGQVVVELEGESDQISIDYYLTNTYHDGLIVKNKPPLYQIFPEDILDGLVVGDPPMSVYLRSTRHAGLVRDSRPPISHFIPTTHHDGLVYLGMPIDRYLATRYHEGLVKRTPSPIDAYIETDHHEGLQV